jgi:hypothetical protein
MMGRLGMLLLAGLLAAAAPPPPPALAPYFHGESFDPGDYGWLHGRFPDASAADRTATVAVDRWSEQCVQDGQERMRAEIAALGVAGAKLQLQAYPGTACAAFSSAGLIDTRPWPTFAAFGADIAEARPIADTFIWATGLAVEKAGPRGPSLADALNALPVGEQMLRTALSWGHGAAGSAPTLEPGVRRVIEARLWGAIYKADHANTEFLKGMVAHQGWPDRRTVGEAAAGNAWLLVQHADADPAFQLRVLRLMEKMLATGGASKHDYAYLYDRVMLKLTGRQRYGTQMHCSAGHFVPQPLENEAALATRRTEMGLETMADYVKGMESTYGRCGADAH